MFIVKDFFPDFFLHVFKDASFLSRYSRFGIPINFGFCLFRAIENNCIEQYLKFFFPLLDLDILKREGDDTK